MSQLIMVAHSHLIPSQIDGVIAIFGERLNNELTREATLKGITLIAMNEAGTVKMQTVHQLTPRLVDLMHKASRQVHLRTLECVCALLKRYPNSFINSTSQLQKEISKFIDESDIQRSSLAIQCAQIIIELNPKLAENAQILQKCAALSGSNLINGQPVVQNLLSLF